VQDPPRHGRGRKGSETGNPWTVRFQAAFTPEIDYGEILTQGLGFGQQRRRDLAVWAIPASRLGP